MSKKQIIWGGNYFYLPPTKCFIVWRKPQITENVSFSMLEYAWTNCEGTSKEWIGMSNEPDRIHPTQKPIKLYEWILNRYAEKGYKILDSHVGSGSSLIACYNLGFQYVGFELDKYYFEEANKRIMEAKKQVTIFDLMQEE